jgi:uncharacterized protein (TIGR02145 family)
MKNNIAIFLGSVLILISSCKKDEEDLPTLSTTINGSGIIINPGTGVTYNGYTYSSIVLGNGQEWMTENLRTASYRNGDPIVTGIDNASWYSNIIGAYDIYNNNMDNNYIYGKLYNWYAVNDPRQLCPTGWHVPTDAEWSSLTDYLGGEAVAGVKMKKTNGWDDFEGQSGNGSNLSGFSGLPGGARFYYDGSFIYSGRWGYWWASSDSTTSDAWCRRLNYDNGNVFRGSTNKKAGFSVRCLKD